MAIRRDEAIILRTRDYSESDRLITFFSRNQGQLTGIAKGARRSKKRFVHTLEPCSHVAVTYMDRRTSGLVRLDASELKNAFTALRSDIARLGYASLSCEIVLHMSPERQANATLFALLCQYLEQLELGAEPENISLLFQTRMLHLSGYGPNLQGCMLCDRRLRAGKNWFFSIFQGGLVCKDHKHGQQPYPVSLGTVMLLRQAQQLPLAKLWRLRFQRQSRQECRFLLIDLVRHYLEKDLKSLKLLYQIGALKSTNDRI
ncbi:MAG: DNA repair protein RecO [Syntrophobacterales bacterium]|jgi:DNA repair protein RecO (recombination protein O)